ncbi:MAG TPA: phosphosulfolactate synthase [Bacteroidales bacterium]|nr:phosphosulfolactate synthase [Bacteroidales bacterium]
MIIYLPGIPDRTAKPRNSGLTMVMDKGLSVREAEDLMSVGSDYIDYLKLGFGTSVFTPGVKDKVRIYESAGVMTYVGGTLFEAFVIRDMFDEYLDLIDKLGIKTVEVSDGSFEMDQELKKGYINRLSEDYYVLSEVGSKKKDVVYRPEEWVEMMVSELEAGSKKVIAEARESGTTGIYNSDGSINTVLIDKLSGEVGFDRIIWEAPLKSQQAWFIKQFGANVNLGNISPAEIIALESLRNGLRGDTFFQFLQGK